jgi:hypothetical protein
MRSLSSSCHLSHLESINVRLEHGTLHSRDPGHLIIEYDWQIVKIPCFYTL